MSNRLGQTSTNPGTASQVKRDSFVSQWKEVPGSGIPDGPLSRFVQCLRVYICVSADFCMRLHYNNMRSSLLAHKCTCVFGCFANLIISNMRKLQSTSIIFHVQSAITDRHHCYGDDRAFQYNMVMLFIGAWKEYGNLSNEQWEEVHILDDASEAVLLAYAAFRDDWNDTNCVLLFDIVRGACRELEDQLALYFTGSCVIPTNDYTIAKSTAFAVLFDAGPPVDMSLASIIGVPVCIDLCSDED